MTRRQVLQLFDHYVRGFIFTDLERSIRAKTNFLTALGLVSYTEFIGGLMTGYAGQTGHSKTNFNEAYRRLGPAYIAFDNEIGRRFHDRRRKPRSVYDIIRCGLVHEYFVKKNFVIARRRVRRSASGVGWFGQKILIANWNYYRDFKLMCLAYRQELLESRAVRQSFGVAFSRKTYLNP